MITLLTVSACGIAVVAAVRSTWSPCGLSMLATITPLAELGRGHRYRTTAAWFVVGSAVGGATLGSVAALVAIGLGAMGSSANELAIVAAGACAVTIAAETQIGGFRLPIHHRQVNERWLDQFRPWVYGAGFGWQIGTGLATYIKTSAVYLMIVLAALTGDPLSALLIGMVFGLVRGLTVFLGRHITSTSALADFHRRFTAADPYALAAVIACEAVATVIFSVEVSAWLGMATALCLSISVLVSALRRHQRKPVATTNPSRPSFGDDSLTDADCFPDRHTVQAATIDASRHPRTKSRAPTPSGSSSRM